MFASQSPESPDACFVEDYQENMHTGAIGHYSRLTHSLLDQLFRDTSSHVVLGLAAGVGQHTKHASTKFSQYYITDTCQAAWNKCDTSDPRVVARQTRELGNGHLSIVYREHINHSPRMRILIESSFAPDTITRDRFPKRLVGWNFGLFHASHDTGKPSTKPEAVHPA